MIISMVHMLHVSNFHGNLGDVIAQHVRVNILTFFIHSLCHLLFSFLLFLLFTGCFHLQHVRGLRRSLDAPSYKSACQRGKILLVYFVRFKIRHRRNTSFQLSNFMSCDIIYKQCRVHAYYFQIFYLVTFVSRNGN
jgi:hypothetical protein